MIRAVLRERPLAAALLVAWLCALLPIWAVRFLPLLDFPNHLGAIAILHRHGDPSWGYDKFYTLNLKPVPYWGHYFPVHLLAYLMPLEAANKVWISLYAGALPLGMAVLARQLGRSPYLALLVCPFVFSFCFALGFLSFCGGVALFPWALWALEAFLERPTVGRGVALTLLSSGLYLMHVLPWMLFGLFAGLILVSHGWQPRRMVAAAGCMLTSVALALYGLVTQQSGQWATATTRRQDTTRIGSFIMRFDDVSTQLRGLKDSWLTQVPRGYVTGLLVVLALAWLGLLVSSRNDERKPGFRWRYEVMLGAAVILYFALPQVIYQPLAWWYIAGRMTLFIALLAALVPRGSIDLRRGWRRFWLVPVMIVAIVYPIDLHAHWHRFHVRSGAFARLMSLVPRGKSTLVLMLTTGDNDVDPNSVPYLEYHAIAQVLSGGFDPWAQATPLGGFPMAVKKDAALPAPYYSRPAMFSMDVHGLHYDYLLTRNEWTDHVLVPNDGRSRLVAQEAEFRLYRVTSPEEEP